MPNFHLDTKNLSLSHTDSFIHSSVEKQNIIMSVGDSVPGLSEEGHLVERNLAMCIKCL